MKIVPILFLITLFTNLNVNASEPVFTDKFSQHISDRYYADKKAEKDAIEARLNKAKSADNYLVWENFENTVFSHCTSVVTGFSNHIGVVGITLSNNKSFTSIEPKMNKLHSILKVCMGPKFEKLKFIM